MQALFEEEVVEALRLEQTLIVEATRVKDLVHPTFEEFTQQQCSVKF